MSPFSDAPLAVGRLLLASSGATALRSAPETASNRASISFLMASCLDLAWREQVADRRRGPHLLLAQVASTERCLEALADLFARDGLKVGVGQDVVDDGGEALELLEGDWALAGRQCLGRTWAREGRGGTHAEQSCCLGTQVGRGS